MGFWDFLRRPAPVEINLPRETVVSADDFASAVIGSSSVAQIWQSQPHLRTVVSFLSRNIAQVGLHVFERSDGDSRVRDRDSVLAKALARPGDNKTSYDLIYALVGDIALYDRAYWLPIKDMSGQAGIRRLPPAWVSQKSSDPFTVTEYQVSIGQRVAKIPAAEVLDFTGYAPHSAITGSPAMESLRQVLVEQAEAAAYRAQVWKRGGRVSAVLERPKDAPAWSDQAREQFRSDWYAKYTGNGTLAGGTPILEDGMKLTRVDFTAQEQQFVEAAKLSLATVAAAFHVNPTMIGQLDNANYSNVREFRKMLYGDTLGPLLAQIEDRINTYLLPMLGMDPARFYVEFNIAEKLQGSFEEQAAVMQTLVGAPMMTRNEGRARFNLPSLGDAFDLPVTPLNVLIGGQASPTDSGSQNAGKAAVYPRAERTPVGVKAAPTAPETAKAREVLGRFFKRQRAVVLSAMGAKADAPDWWDTERWNRELADDLLALGLTVTAAAARRAIEKAGGDPDDYDVDRTAAWVRAKAEAAAANINDTTLQQLSESDDPAHTFDVAESARVPAAAVTLTTSLAAFGTHEAASQTGAGTKTWITGTNPRPEHAAMDGETVPIAENFSNGMAWPGDSSDADEVAGCNCSISFDY